MKTSSVFNKQTGRFLGVVTSVRDYDPPDDNCLVVDGAYHRYSYLDAEGVPVANDPPVEGLRFDFQAMQWVNPRTLQVAQREAWDRIKAARTAFIDSPLTTPHGTFDCTPVSRTRITDAVLMLQTLAGMGQPATIDFTLADNSTVTLTAAQMVEVGLLMGQRVQVAFAIGRQRRAAIEAATTIEGVESIVW